MGMKKNFPVVVAMLFILFGKLSTAQGPSLWTEKDRQFLVKNLERTRNEVQARTSKLSEDQWQFKPDTASWSVAQVVEHMGLYERIFIQEADIMLSADPDPALDSLSAPDSVYIDWMNDPGKHIADWNAQPLGLMKGKDNLVFFVFARDKFIEFVRKTDNDLKSHFTYRWGKEKRRSIHALIVVHFAHTDRHLKQINRIIQHQNFPRDSK
jgi:hypothetical protein